MPNTPILALPLLAADQAQKHVTMNDALNILDGRVGNWMRVVWTSSTIASGVLTVASSAVLPVCETGAADDITSLAGAADGTMVVLAGTTSVTITLIDGGNLKLGAATRVLNSADDTLTLIRRGTNWLEIAFANNG